MHRFLAPGAAGGRVELDADEAHHLVNVVRLGPGEEVVVFDGRGHEWVGKIASTSRHRVAIDLLDRRSPVPEPAVAVTLVVGLLKGDQMDAVIRDAAMLGVAAIVPVTSAHVAVPAAGIRARSVERWQRVAVASVKQCARSVVPEIRPVTAFPAALADSRAELTIVCVEPARASGAKVTELARPRTALICVGPEGGWSREEVQLARELDAALIALGPRTLRAAAVPAIAMAALWTHWGWE